MSTEKTDKQALKELRAARREWIGRATAASRSQKKILQAIRGVLEAQPASVPEIAAAIDQPTATVMWFVAGMKKYGQLIEAGQDDCYFRYTLTEEKPAEAEPEAADA